MEIFMPSEIARLVLGYLKEENCQETMKCFLSECIHLAEYKRMLGLGREFPTCVGDLSLKKLINEFGRMRQAENSISNNFSVNAGLENTNPFKTPSTNTVHTPSCITPTIAAPLTELVEIAGSMEKQLKALVVATPTINEHLAPHFFSFAGRRSSNSQSHRTIQKAIAQKDSNQKAPKNLDKNGNDKIDEDIAINSNCSGVNNNNNDNDNDLPNNAKKNVRNERKRAVRTKRNAVEDFAAMDPARASDPIERPNNIQTSGDDKKKKKVIKTRACSVHLELIPESPVSSLEVQIAPQKLPISTPDPDERIHSNAEVPVSVATDELELSGSPRSATLVINTEAEEQLSSQVPIQNIPEIQTGAKASSEPVLQTFRKPLEEQTNMAEYFAKFDSTLLPSDVEDTSDGIGPPLHNSTSLVSLDEHSPTPINFDHNASLVIHGSSPDIFGSREFQGAGTPSTNIGEFSFPSGRFKPVESAPIIEFQPTVTQPVNDTSAILAPPNHSSSRSLKFRKLSQRFIAEHHREQSILQSARENSNGSRFRRTVGNTNSNISSSSEAKRFSEVGGAVDRRQENQIRDDCSESSQFSFRHIADIVNFDDDSRTIDAPFVINEPEISSQVVSSSRLVGSPEYSNSPLSCPSSTPLKRPLNEPQPPQQKRKKKDLKSMDIETFLAKIHQR